MHVIVLVRRCVDTKSMVRIAPDQTRIETHGLKMGINPFDDVALEHALQLRERGDIQTITVVGIGDDFVRDTLHHAMAMGADQAIHIAATTIIPLLTAQTLHKIVGKEAADLIILGAQNPDDGFGHEGIMAATLLGWECIPSFIGMAQHVISADYLLAAPRRVMMPHIIAARSRPIRSVTLADLGIADNTPPPTIVSIAYPAMRPPVTMLSDFDALCQVIEKARA